MSTSTTVHVNRMNALLNDFRSEIHKFVCLNLTELYTRHAAGEHGFSYELTLDRSHFDAVYNDALLKNMFFDMVHEVTKGMKGVLIMVSTHETRDSKVPASGPFLRYHLGVVAK